MQTTVFEPKTSFFQSLDGQGKWRRRNPKTLSKTGGATRQRTQISTLCMAWKTNCGTSEKLLVSQNKGGYLCIPLGYMVGVRGAVGVVLINHADGGHFQDPPHMSEGLQNKTFF